MLAEMVLIGRPGFVAIRRRAFYAKTSGGNEAVTLSILKTGKARAIRFSTLMRSARRYRANLAIFYGLRAMKKTSP